MSASLWSRWRERQGLLFFLCVIAVCAIAVALTPAGGYWRAWPHGRPGLYRINDRLVLAIPPEYQRFWLQGAEVVRAPAAASAIPRVPSVSFSFFLPHYSGFTPRNFRRDIDAARVDVVALAPATAADGQPGTSAFYTPNILDRILASTGEGRGRELHGLRCYQPSGLGGDQWLCFGPVGEEPSRQIMLWTALPPYQPDEGVPMMRAQYYTARYGGLKISWRAQAAHLAQWRDIDAHIWELVSQWNVADTLQTAQEPQSMGPGT